MLLEPPRPIQPVPEDAEPYGEVCTTNTDSVFREGDAVDLGFKLVGREPYCHGESLYPWNWGELSCDSYKDATPSASQPIDIEIIDGVSGTKTSTTCDGDFDYTMNVTVINPFAPFSRQLDLEFTRPFDGAVIYFARYVLVLGSIPEKVPQVWTTAVEGLIFSIIRDPPGGASTATLVEGSTISTAMAIEGAHAATLAEANNIGGSGGIQGGFNKVVELDGVGILFNGFGFGLKGGVAHSTSTAVTVNRGSSQHFDVGISFDVAISTSSSPYLAGQPSDVIIGGGANLRFISAIEVYATEHETGSSSAHRLCLQGRTAEQFLPEQVTTYVISVYEIERLIERLGAAIRDQATGNLIFKGEDVTPAVLQKQIETWQKVLANYRATTVRTDLPSVAAQLDDVLDTLKADFTTFKKDLTHAEDSELTIFVRDGIEVLVSNIVLKSTQSQKEAIKSAPPSGDISHGGFFDTLASFTAQITGNTIDNKAKQASARLDDASKQCASATDQVLPSESHNLCAGYSDLANKLSLVTTLLGVCNFAKEVRLFGTPRGAA